MASVNSEVNWTFEELVYPQHVALLVIDIQKDFCDDDGAMARLGKDLSVVKAMLPRLLNLIEFARGHNIKVIFTRRVNSALTDSLSHRRQLSRGGALEVALDGTPGVDFSKGFEPKDSDYVLVKRRYSAFTGTELDLVLRSNGVRTIVLTGVATNACVESTARDGFMLDYHVVLLSDCCATYDSPDLHEATLRNAEMYFATVASFDQLVNVWQGLSRKR